MIFFCVTLITGVMATDDHDVDYHITVEKKTTDKIVRQPVFSYLFKTKDKTVTLCDASTIKVTPEEFIDPVLLLVGAF